MFSRIGSHNGYGCLWIATQSCWKGCRADGSMEEWHRRIPGFRVKSWTCQHLYTSAKRKVTRERSKGTNHIPGCMFLKILEIRTHISREFWLSPSETMAAFHQVWIWHWIEAWKQPWIHIMCSGVALEVKDEKGDPSHVVRLMFQITQKIVYIFEHLVYTALSLFGLLILEDQLDYIILTGADMVCHAMWHHCTKWLHIGLSFRAWPRGFGAVKRCRPHLLLSKQKAKEVRGWMQRCARVLF